MNSRSNMIKVAVVGGEGIGPEVTAQSHRILNWFATKRGVPVTLREAQYGLIPYLATGKVLPEDTVEAMEEADAILWGATGGPETKEVPAAARKAGSLLSLRSKYDLYANLRPIVASPALADSAPLKAEVLKVSISSSSASSPAAFISESRAVSRRFPTGNAAASIPSNIPPTRSAASRAQRSSWRGREGIRSVRWTRPMCSRPAWCGVRR
jgi:hypothetical protein